jgi:putative transposase
MSRKCRILRENATYHVVSSINRYEKAFESDTFKELFLSVLTEAKVKFKFEIRNFTIMPDHTHILIHPLGGIFDLPKIMQWIMGVFAKRYNKICNYKGHLWRTRYWSKIIDDIFQFLTVFDYISNNPVKAGISETSSKYEYGGLYFILRKIFDIVSPPDLNFNF